MGPRPGVARARPHALSLGAIPPTRHFPRGFIVPSIQSADTVRINADLLRRLAAVIGLAGEPLAAVCERIVSDIRAGVAPIDGAARLDPSSDTVEDA